MPGVNVPADHSDTPSSDFVYRAVAIADKQTTNATEVGIASYNIYPEGGSVPTTGIYWLIATVIARKSDGSVGAFWRRSAALRMVGGVLTQIGTTQDEITPQKDAGASSWDLQIEISGNGFDVNVTGEAATTIDWWARIERFSAINQP